MFENFSKRDLIANIIFGYTNINKMWVLPPLSLDNIQITINHRWSQLWYQTDNQQTHMIHLQPAHRSDLSFQHTQVH
jgi:hypothetical protein